MCINMANIVKTLLIVCFALISLNNLYAEPAKDDTFDIRLITFSPVDDVFSWFGHAAIEVKNNSTDQSYTYSFGGFSFDSDDAVQFAFGRFVFWGFAHESRSYLYSYEREKRQIVYQTLNLTSEQELKLREKLADYIKPENRSYVYDHFYDNCSTRLRDIINEVLDGKLKEQMSETDSLTFRQYIHRMTSHLSHLDFILLFLLNDKQDQPITLWDSMFLPDRLMIGFQKAKNPVTGELLVKKEEGINITNDSVFFKPEALVPNTVLRESLIGLSFFLLLSISGFYFVKEERFFNRLYPGLVSIFAMVFGILGSGLFFMMFFTDHHDCTLNENLFLLNPFTLLLLPLGIMGILGKGKRLFCRISILCSMIALAGVGLKILPMFDQNNSQQLRVLLPALLMMGMIGIQKLREEKRANLPILNKEF